MGRIKSTLVKRTTKRLLTEENLFSEEFNHNKKILGSRMPSKKIRNKIAGYMAHVLKMQSIKKKQAPVTPAPPQDDQE